MKTIYCLCLLGWLALPLQAQDTKYSRQRELRGSGQLVREDRTVAAFQAIELSQFPADVTIEVGGTQSEVHIQLDDNLKPFLQLESINGLLKLYFKDPDNNPFWISKDSIRVTIKTPVLNRFLNGSNSDVVVRGLRGKSFELTNQANGGVTLQGAVDQLTILSQANGSVHAEGLSVQRAGITAQANATIAINASQYHVSKTGHATVLNSANTATTTKLVEKSARAFVSVVLFNSSALPRTVTLRFTEAGSTLYGVVSARLGPYEKRQETYPVGTTIEQLNPAQQKLAMTGERIQGTRLAILKESDNGRTYKLLDD